MKKETLHLNKITIMNLSTAEDTLDREEQGKINGGSNIELVRSTIIPVMCS